MSLKIVSTAAISEDFDEMPRIVASHLGLHHLSKFSFTSNLSFSFWIQVNGMGTLIDREDLDEMSHKVAFHQGLHCLLRER